MRGGHCRVAFRGPLGARCLVVGEDTRLGKDNTGNIDTLRELGPHAVNLSGVSGRFLEDFTTGQVIASTEWYDITPERWFSADVVLPATHLALNGTA